MARSILLYFTLCFSTWAAAQCAGTTIPIYVTDFEDGPGILIASDHPAWEHGVIGSNNWSGASCGSSSTPPTAAVSGTMGWGTLLNDCYDNSGDTSTVSLTVDLSDPALTSANLQFRSFYDIFTNFDYIFIHVNNVQVYMNNTTDNSPGWVTQVVDLTPFLGDATVDIDLHLFATTVVNRAGWYIDDLEVTGCIPSTSVADMGSVDRTRIWPNPSNGSVNVQIATGQGDVVSWRLLDGHGREVRRGGMLPAGAVSALELQGMRGMYVFEMNSAERSWHERIVLQ